MKQTFLSKLSISSLIIVTLIALNSCTIFVRAPKKLASQFPNGQIQGSISKFGKIPYGYNIVGSLYYDTKSLEKNSLFLGCTDAFSLSIKLSKNADIDESPIVLIDRGTCSFVKKVTNAENFGAHAALIINNNDEDVNNLVMADDGNGKYVTIPAELINKSDGEKLKTFLKENPNTEVSIEIDFEIEERETVELSLYMLSNQVKVYSLLDRFNTYYKSLNKSNSVVIKPHYVTNPHPLYELGITEDKSPFTDCYGDGKYCLNGFYIKKNDFATENMMTNFDLNDFNNPETIIEENLIQKCIYNYSLEIKKPNLYYDYMVTFYKSCIQANNFTKECGKANMLKFSELNNDDLNKCVYDSFKFSNPLDTVKSLSERKHVENTILEKDNDQKNIYYVKYIPSILVNGKVFWGNWTEDNILEIVCASLIKKPDVCFTYGGLTGIKNDNFNSNSNLIYFLIFFSFVITLGIFLYCKYQIQRNINNNLDSSNFGHKINTVVTTYLALKDPKGNKLETSSSNSDNKNNTFEV